MTSSKAAGLGTAILLSVLTSCGNLDDDQQQPRCICCCPHCFTETLYSSWQAALAAGLTLMSGCRIKWAENVDDLATDND
jgi:hypothetical protein